MRKRWEIAFKKVVLEYAKGIGKVSESCREFGVSRSTFYVWRKNYQENGTAGLMPRRPVALHHPKALPQETVGKILELRKGYGLGPQRICWYLERYHGIKTSCASVYRTLLRHGVSRTPRNVGRRAIHTHRYAKAVPGHHVQVDVKILSLKAKRGRLVRRFQYTAIDDATRVRALKIYTRHNQTNAVNFIDYVVDKFPFRMHTIRTDRGHEFQALFHWHAEDKGMRHIYIKPRSPEVNGKVERFHRTDQEEFYQLLTFKDDVDLNKKLQPWEAFYNFNRPHGSLNGKTPYEVLESLLK